MIINGANSGIGFYMIKERLSQGDQVVVLDGKCFSSPVPSVFMADPEKVGIGLAKRLKSKRLVICHRFAQKLQTQLMYLFPVSFGRFLSKTTEKSEKQSNSVGKKTHPLFPKFDQHC